MKTVLSIWHTGDKGKTETLREFAMMEKESTQHFVGDLIEMYDK